MILLSKYIKGALAHFFQENIVFESLKKDFDLSLKQTTTYF